MPFGPALQHYLRSCASAGVAGKPTTLRHTVERSGTSRCAGIFHPPTHAPTQASHSLNHNILIPCTAILSSPSLPTKRHGAPLLIVDSSRLLAISLPTSHTSHSLTKQHSLGPPPTCTKLLVAKNSDRPPIRSQFEYPSSVQNNPAPPATTADRAAGHFTLQQHNTTHLALHCICSLRLAPASPHLTHTALGNTTVTAAEDRAATQYTKHLSWLSIAAQTVHLF